jgi:hypothetical protein
MKMSFLALALWIAGICLMVALGSGCVWINRPVLGVYAYTDNHSNGNMAAPLRIIHIWVDDRFGAEDLGEMYRAVSTWNYVLNGYVVFRWNGRLHLSGSSADLQRGPQLTDPNLWVVVKRKSGDGGFFPDKIKRVYPAWGFADKIGGNTISLVRDYFGVDAVYGLMLHEMAHCLGADHLGDRLMKTNFDLAAFQCVDLTTVAQVAKYLGLDIKNLNYCTD